VLKKYSASNTLGARALPDLLRELTGNAPPQVTDALTPLVRLCDYITQINRSIGLSKHMYAVRCLV